MSENTINHFKSEPDKHTREEFNLRLKDKFSCDVVTGLPMWRVAWAPDQFNIFHGTFNDFSSEGIFLRTVTETREVPKYPHLGGKYILEMLMAIPNVNQKDLPSANLSYECMHPYMHSITSEYLPLNWVFTEWVIDCYYAGLGQGSLRKYVDPDADGNNGLTEKAKTAQKIYDYLYGNETKVTDALAYETGVFLDSTKALKAN